MVGTVVLVEAEIEVGAAAGVFDAQALHKQPE
jgi:hypothetical protein